MIDISEEIPFVIPKSWRWVRMGNIGDWGAASTSSRTNLNYYCGDICWLKTGELNNGIGYDTKEKVTQEALQDCSLRINKNWRCPNSNGATIDKLAIAGK